MISSPANCEVVWNKDDFLKKFDTDGFVIVPNVLTPGFIANAKKELELAIELESKYHNSKSYADYGMVLVCAKYGGAFLDLFENDQLLNPINAVLGDSSIVYAYTSSSMPPGSTNYSHRVHVDSPRIIPNYVTNVGVTILLDDFSESNGATYYLPKSHIMKEKPTEEYFFSNAKRLIAKAGTVWFFNARLWHAGGLNTTDSWRHALTINMCRPYMKQRLDLPRLISTANIDTGTVSDKVLQKLGFHAQVPASYEEYYAPPELRKYRANPE